MNERVPRTPESGAFDPYHKWLGIPPQEQPPNHYRLLGIPQFESDVDVISHAADQRMAHVRTLQVGRHSGLSQRILNEISSARVCLLDAGKRAVYDTQLRKKIQRQESPPPAPSVLTVGPEVPAISPAAQRRIEQQQRAARSKTRNWLIAGTLGATVAVGSIVGWVRSRVGGPEEEKKPAAAKNLSQKEVDAVRGTTPASPAPLPEEKPRMRRPVLVDMPQAQAQDPKQEQVASLPVLPELPALQEEEPQEVVEPLPVPPPVTDPVVHAEEGQGEEQKAQAEQQFRQAVGEAMTRLSPAYVSLPPQKILEGATGEQDPVLRTALFGVAVQQAAEDGDTATMNDALAQMQHAGEEEGLTAQDAFFFKLATIRRIANPHGLNAMDATKRMALAQDLYDNCIPEAYRQENLALARELRELALLGCLNTVIPNSFPASGRVESTAALIQLRKALIAEEKKQKELQGLYDAHAAGLDADGEPLTPDAERKTGLWKMSIGKWEEALVHLIRSGDPIVARAARMESDAPKQPAELLACMQAWMAAAESDPEYAKQWYERAAAMVYRAKQLGPTGKMGLDVTTAEAELKRRGVGETTNNPSNSDKPNVKPPDKNWTPVDLSKLSGKGFTSRNNENVLLALGSPVSTEFIPTNSYELAMKITLKGKNYFGIHLPVGNNSVWVLFYGGSSRHALSKVHVNGQMTNIIADEQNETRIETGEKVDIKISVIYTMNNRTVFTTITVFVQGKQVLEHTAPTTAFGVLHEHGWKDAKGIAFMQHRSTIETNIDSVMFRIVR
ncbi:MAG: hypothetical protein PHU04_01215 [Candidatus Peribacteraceae bacterium]|nr:hypothetical protein [Candidatus Peribacteraceae bacterium]